jgi:hypothetical protein
MAWLIRRSTGVPQPGAAEAPSESPSILYFTERRRLDRFLHLIQAVCESLYARGSIDGRRQMASGQALFPEADRALMEQAWAGFRERHGSRSLQLSFKGRRREDLAQAGLLGIEWRQRLEAVAVARSKFVRDGDEAALRALIQDINSLLEGLLRVAEPGPVLEDLAELLRDLKGRRFERST